MNHSNHTNYSLFGSSWGRSFLVTLFFVTLASSLFWLDGFRSYEAETQVLVIGKTATVNATEVANNLAILTRSLAFYDHVLADNDHIDDQFGGYAPDQRKALWNKKLTVRRKSQSSILTLAIADATPENDQVFSKQAVQTLFTVAGFYYNVRTDIDLRIIDGPIVRTTIARPLMYVGASLGTGIVITVIFFFLLRIAPYFQFSRAKVSDTHMSDFSDSGTINKDEQALYSIGETVPYIDPRKFIPSKPSALSFETSRSGSVGRPGNGHVSGTKAPAPANLPIADDADASLMEQTVPFDFGEIFPESEARTEQLVFPVRGEHEIMKQPRSSEKALGTATQDTNPLLAVSEEQSILNEILFPEKTLEPQVSNQDEPQTETVTPVDERAEPSADEYKRRLNELLAGGK